jgi:hypothetical protein
MRTAIEQLEKTARLLEPASDKRNTLNEEVLLYADGFLNRIPDEKGYEKEDTSQRLYDLPFNESGYNLSTLLDTLAIAVDHPGINPASGGHIGYIPGGGLYPSALADYMACVTNRYAGIYFASPGAVRMENMLIRWMSDMVGYPMEALRQSHFRRQYPKPDRDHDCPRCDEDQVRTDTSKRNLSYRAYPSLCA